MQVRLSKLRNLQVHKIDQTEDDVEVFLNLNMLQHFVKGNHRAIMGGFFFERGLWFASISQLQDLQPCCFSTKNKGEKRSSFFSSLKFPEYAVYVS